MTQTMNKGTINRLSAYSDKHWEMVKNLARYDQYPKEAGTYHQTFLSNGTVSADQRFQMFLDRMTKTRLGFRIIAVNEGYRKVSVTYSHNGFDEGTFAE